MRAQDLALQRDKYRHLTDAEWRWLLQQTEGRERTMDKLPTFAAIEDWWYPVRLSCEQCSSEATARYKASLVSGRQMADLTAGYGVDTFFLSEHFEQSDYVEQNEELCRIAAHNFSFQRSTINIHSTTAEAFLVSAGQYDLIYMDPARRDSHGGKVFRLEDCTPNVVEMLPTLLAHLTEEGQIMLKLSPMLDLTQALKELSVLQIQWSVYIVAVKNEVKEVLLLSREKSTFSHQPSDVRQTITAIDLMEPEKAFVFTREEEQDCPWGIGDWSLIIGHFLYEPNAAILKAGAYKLVAQRYGLRKLDVNTHLYASDRLVADFPGRAWQISGGGVPEKGSQANILTRNYPLSPEQIKKKLHLRDGGTVFLIGCRIAGKPTLLQAERV